ncbi:MAG TPA: biotin/lipoyl-containing protein [Terriglobales bacterium]|nr:biotin/lipoyl-containing protein [Terriglobales bacterium]
MIYDVTIEGKQHRVELRHSNGGWLCKVDDKEIPLDVNAAGDGVLSLLLNGKSYEVKRDVDHVWVGGNRYSAEVRDPRSLRSRRSAAEGEDGPRKLVASMPGKVVRVLVEEKASVEAGQGIVVVEAMKMQNEIKSPKKGVVQKLSASVGASVNAGDLLAIVE